MPSDFTVSSGDTALADIEVCRRVATDLQDFYPGHLWMVGADHQAGTVIIDLPYPKPFHLRNARFMLYISTCLGSDSRKHVMRAGGDLLERFGLPRNPAQPEAHAMASEHGLDASHIIRKSKS